MRGTKCTYPCSVGAGPAEEEGLGGLQPSHFFENYKEILRERVFSPPPPPHYESLVSPPSPLLPPPHFQSRSAVPGGKQSVLTNAPWGRQSGLTHAQWGQQSVFTYAQWGQQSVLTHALWGEQSVLTHAQWGQQSGLTHAPWRKQSVLTYALWKKQSGLTHALWGQQIALTHARWRKQSRFTHAQWGQQVYSPMPCGGNEIEATVHPAVHNMSSIQSWFITKVILKLIFYILQNWDKTAKRMKNTINPNNLHVALVFMAALSL